MTTYRSGLSAQLGLKAETTVGTAVTVDTFYEILNESLTWTPTWLDGAGLKAGQAYKRKSRTIQSTFTVDGDFTIEHLDAGHMGLLWKHALGSSLTSATQISTGTAYSQIHTPGSKSGLGATIQVGRPQTALASGDPVVNAFTYRGCKFTDWEFSCKDGQNAQLKLTVDGWDEATDTDLVTASYTADAGLFDFKDATIKLGGTASTASGETSISGGTAAATIVSGVTITGSTPMSTDRYGLGNSGTKNEQIENDVPTIMVELDGEFTNRTEFYDLLADNTVTALQIDFSHGAADTGQPFLLSFIFPAVRVKTDPVNVAGPDVLAQKATLEAYDDGTNPVVQVKLVSTDTTL